MVEKNKFPSLAQKHFNGTDYILAYSCPAVSLFNTCFFVQELITIAQESVILARWLMGVTMAVAEKAPEDEHAQLLDKKC